MAIAAPAAENVVHCDVSIVRLHGEACFHCGSVRRPLRPAGSVTVPTPGGGTKAWRVVTCGCYQPAGR
ncbi:hypothetical protein [Streptomyces sp. CMB-StM0423]|uniref:hypothetical protein n=1 Tax=Streptomyces sp. CMB-StM0423 TaxID=2059884 RepID=UPI000C70B770|nr:hypothetical protein [Streptomyces sp. CMB-StM0423]AUH40475.1 hypothetical protein CXR04_09590 [Streptomyces sp. CMB-StM0423]